jgi:hypothetical protein
MTYACSFSVWLRRFALFSRGKSSLPLLAGYLANRFVCALSNLPGRSTFDALRLPLLFQEGHATRDPLFRSALRQGIPAAAAHSREKPLPGSGPFCRLRCFLFTSERKEG